MKRVKEIDIKNCTYFFDHMINIKNLDSNKIKLDKKPYKKKKIIYHIGYKTVKDLSYAKINNMNHYYE